MALQQKVFFAADVWRTALEKYGAVTHLTVSLYDCDATIVCGPTPLTPLVALFERYAHVPEIMGACARQCLAQTDHRPLVLAAPSGLAVVGTPLQLAGRTRGAAVAGYALVDFCQATAIASLARDAGIPFNALWDIARRQQPVSHSRLTLHGELLQVLGDTLLQENARTREYEQSSARFEFRVGERTRELAATNAALAAELHERRAADERIRRLLAQLVSVQEGERKRIARDLHDHLGQQMTALQLKLGSLTAGQDDVTNDRVTDLRALVLQLDRDLRFFTRELRPAALYDIGLAAALTDFVEAYAENYGIAVSFEAVGMPEQRLAPDLEINLYRIAQEALNNVHKHAVPSKVDVFLQYRDGSVVLSVIDDGIGFDADAAGREHDGLGLTGMRERAALVGGRVELETRPGEGTSIIASAPARFVDHRRSTGADNQPWNAGAS